MTYMADISGTGLSGSDFRRLAEFIHHTAGIKMPPSKKTMLEGRLRRRVRVLGMADFREYCAFLFDENGLDAEAVHLIDAVTTNKTDFFREPDHFRLLAERVLPGLAEEGRGHERPLIAWSAAASTGAEAYSMAMVLADFAQARRGFRFAVLATDICTEVLETASLAIYPEAMIDPVPMPMRKRYLLRARDPACRTVRIAPELRRHVHFAHMNLVEGPYEVDEVDVVFLRNVLIYFDKPTQEAVVGNICAQMARGGYLFIGHSESIAGFGLPLRQVATTVFQRE